MFKLGLILCYTVLTVNCYYWYPHYRHYGHHDFTYVSACYVYTPSGYEAVECYISASQVCGKKNRYNVPSAISHTGLLAPHSELDKNKPDETTVDPTTEVTTDTTIWTTVTTTPGTSEATTSETTPETTVRSTTELTETTTMEPEVTTSKPTEITIVTSTATTVVTTEGTTETTNREVESTTVYISTEEITTEHTDTTPFDTTTGILETTIDVATTTQTTTDVISTTTPRLPVEEGGSDNDIDVIITPSTKKVTILPDRIDKTTSMPNGVEGSGRDVIGDEEEEDGYEDYSRDDVYIGLNDLRDDTLRI